MFAVEKVKMSEFAGINFTVVRDMKDFEELIFAICENKTENVKLYCFKSFGKIEKFRVI